MKSVKKETEQFTVSIDSRQETLDARDFRRGSPNIASNMERPQRSTDGVGSRIKRLNMLPSLGSGLNRTFNKKEKSSDSKKELSSARERLRLDTSNSNLIGVSRYSPPRSFLYDPDTSSNMRSSGGSPARKEKLEAERHKSEMDKLATERDFLKEQVKDLKIQLELSFEKSIHQSALDSGTQELT